MVSRLKKLWPWLLLILLLALAPFASSFPDGLERVARDLGFMSAERSVGASPMPDYTVPTMGDSGISTIIAGGIGAAVLFIGFWAIDKMRSH